MWYVKEWRKLREIGQSDLADRCRMSRSALIALENGETARPHAGTIQTIARVLGCQVEQLKKPPGGTGQSETP